MPWTLPSDVASCHWQLLSCCVSGPGADLASQEHQTPCRVSMRFPQRPLSAQVQEEAWSGVGVGGRHANPLVSQGPKSPLVSCWTILVSVRRPVQGCQSSKPWPATAQVLGATPRCRHLRRGEHKGAWDGAGESYGFSGLLWGTHAGAGRYQPYLSLLPPPGRGEDATSLLQVHLRGSTALLRSVGLTHPQPVEALRTWAIRAAVT